MDGVEFERVPTNGIHLHVAVAGPPDGPPVVLLHGFPESWYCWRFQIPALVAAGFRVYAPNLRGYGRSDKPRGARHYGLDTLAADVVGLLDHYGIERADIVGHDWGAMITWHLGRHHPERALRLTVMNCPPLDVVRATVLSSLSQARLSWYVFVFQLPWIPERMLSKNNFSRCWAAMAKMATHRDKFTPADREVYLETWTQPGCATGMLAYYRGILRAPPSPPRHHPIPNPVLMLWGTADHALSEDMIAPSLDQGLDVRVRRLEGISHWVNVDAWETVNPMLIAWLSGEEPALPE